MRRLTLALVGLAAVAMTMSATAAEWGLKKGSPRLRSISALAFGPDGILFVGDAKAATIVALDTGDNAGDAAKVTVNVKGLKAKLAKLLGDSSDIAIEDLAVNPISGNVYVGVSSGDKVGLARIDAATQAVTSLPLTDVPCAQAVLSNAPADKVTGEGRRKRNMRYESITDLAYIDGKLIVSGLSNADSPSTVRELPFPFAESETGVSLEIYHGAHGRYEDYAAVRTLVPFNIDGQPSLLMGFTCTPLVKLPLQHLKESDKVRGTTVAELGNRNRPLDMIVYTKNGQDYVLMANSARGVMKITTEGLNRNEGITSRVGGGGLAGQTYETIKELDGVVQLDALNDSHAVVLVQADGGEQDLRTIDLP